MTPRTDDLAQRLFDWLDKKYVQRSDARQKAMGLQYMEAETHELSNNLATFVRSMLAEAERKGAEKTIDKEKDQTT